MHGHDAGKVCYLTTAPLRRYISQIEEPMWDSPGKHPMLSSQTLKSIKREAVACWTSEAKRPEIVGIAKGKEIGHKLADLVDEKTTALLTVKYLTKRQRDAAGRTRSRSMGNLWLHENGIYHPVNVKTGIVGAEGQPNLVSLKKVLSAVMARQIDSYYLLIVKMQIGEADILPSVYLVDMLDWLEYVTFDSGPGQMMLRAVKFFKEFDAKKVRPLDIKQKAQRLMDLYEDGERRLRANRQRDLGRYRHDFRVFMAGEDFSVTPATQESLHLA
jgi:hypothetical protein